ncbi:MAG: SusC/RagA family TonB-linked outer membrane protein, partial [Polaribacter sp.]
AAANNNRVETFGASTSFIFSKLLPQNNILSFGKVRVSFAEAPSFPDAYANNITYDTGAAYASYGAQWVSSVYPNPNLIGGKKSEIELGTELKFLKNRIGIDLTYFKKVTKELPISISLDGSTGFTSTNSNGGKQTTKGLELVLSANPIRTNFINWDFNINFATLTRTVDKIAPGIEQNYLDGGWGISLLAKKGKEYGALYGRKYKRDANGNKILSSVGALRYDPNQYLGNFLPDFTGGLSNNVTIGNFNVGFDIDFQSGGKIYSVSTMFAAESGISPRTVQTNKLGNPVRDPLTTASGKPTENYSINANLVGNDSGGVYIKGVDEKSGKPIAYYVNPYRYYKSLEYLHEEWLYNNTYIKLRTLRIDYNLPQSILKKTPFKDVNLGMYANNLWMIYASVPNTDNSEINSAFIEDGQNPSVRTFGINVKLTF